MCLLDGRMCVRLQKGSIPLIARMPTSSGALGHSGFPRLWLGQSVSLAGSQVTLIALPLTAVLTLHAGPTQMGALRVASTAPFLLLGLLAGAWVDRRSRLAVLVFSSVGQALLLACIPLLVLTGMLRIDLLYGVTFLVGVLTVLADVSYQAFVATLVRAEALVDANSKLETSRSMAQVVGPSIGGLVVQLVSAPFAILVDTASFLFSAVLLRSIRDPEPERPPAPRSSILREVWEGLVALLGHPVLGSITAATTLVNLAISISTPIMFLYLARTLALGPPLIGVVVTIWGLGGVLGAIAGGRAAGRLPVQVILGLGLVLCGFAGLLTASATGSLGLVMAILLVGQLMWGFGVPFYNVNQLSLRQSLTPARLQARVHATSRTLTWGAIPIGAFLGGQLGEHLGLRPTLVISGLGTLVAALIAYFGVMLASRRVRGEGAG